MKKAGFYLFYGLLGTAAAFAAVTVLARAVRCCQMWTACCCGDNPPQNPLVKEADTKSFDFESNPGTQSADEAQREAQFIGNPRTRKFHLLTCRTAPQTQDSVLFETRQDALMNDYVPCGICNP